MALIGTVAVHVLGKTAQFNKSMRAAGGTVARFQTSIKGVAGSLARLVLPIGITAGLYKMARAAETFNQAMAQSLAIMSNVSDTMRRKMERAALDVAGSTTFSADQAAKAYFYLASAGYDAQQSLAAMPKVAKFAQAGNFDLALATDLLTDAQSALGLSSKNAAENQKNLVRVSDVLVKANTLANASTQQFSEALTNKAGAALKVVGKDIEEGVAVLAAFADQGVKSSDAGTALNIVMRDLQTKAIQNKQAFKDAGISVFDAGGEMRNMADIIGDVEKALAGMSDEKKKDSLLQVGFTDKSVAYLQTLIGTSEKIRDYEKALRAAGGTTDRVATKTLTPFQKAWNKLKGAFAEISQALAPVIEMFGELASAVAGALKTIQPLLSVIGKAVGFLGKVVAAPFKLIGKIGEGIRDAFGAGPQAAVDGFRDKLAKLSSRELDDVIHKLRVVQELGFNVGGFADVAQRQKEINKVRAELADWEKAAGGKNPIDALWQFERQQGKIRARAAAFGLTSEYEHLAEVMDKVREKSRAWTKGQHQDVFETKAFIDASIADIMRAINEVDDLDAKIKTISRPRPYTGPAAVGGQASIGGYRAVRQIEADREADRLWEKMLEEAEHQTDVLSNIERDLRQVARNREALAQFQL